MAKPDILQHSQIELAPLDETKAREAIAQTREYFNIRDVDFTKTEHASPTQPLFCLEFKTLFPAEIILIGPFPCLLKGTISGESTPKRLIINLPEGKNRYGNILWQSTLLFRSSVSKKEIVSVMKHSGPHASGAHYDITDQPVIDLQTGKTPSIRIFFGCRAFFKGDQSNSFNSYLLK
ncbi:hypothetical protein L6272_01045 [Microgenomates group bacterium]|nr:hypothetical protein [Microgenomates group bacterium]